MLRRRVKKQMGQKSVNLCRLSQEIEGWRKNERVRLCGTVKMGQDVPLNVLNEVTKDMNKVFVSVYKNLRSLVMPVNTPTLTGSKKNMPEPLCLHKILP